MIKIHFRTLLSIFIISVYVSFISYIKQKGLQLLEVLFDAADRNRTGTRFNSNRILSPARLPVPPLRLNGGRRIRTFEGGANRFTVCPLWPLGNPTKCLPDN